MDQGADGDIRLTRDAEGAPIILSPWRRFLYGASGTKFMLCLVSIVLATCKIQDDSQYVILVLGALGVYAGSNVANNVAASRQHGDAGRPP